MQCIEYFSTTHQGSDVVSRVDPNTGCRAIISHKSNADGYIRKCFGNNGKKVFKMFHRFKWEEVNGPIPEGYEIDHKCRNRTCCNVEHLQLLGISEHKVKTNRERYSERSNQIKKDLVNGLTVKAICEKYQISRQTVAIKYNEMISWQPIKK